MWLKISNPAFFCESFLISVNVWQFQQGINRACLFSKTRNRFPQAHTIIVKCQMFSGFLQRLMSFDNKRKTTKRIYFQLQTPDLFFPKFFFNNFCFNGPNHQQDLEFRSLGRSEQCFFCHKRLLLFFSLLKYSGLSQAAVRVSVEIDGICWSARLMQILQLKWICLLPPLSKKVST